MKEGSKGNATDRMLGVVGAVILPGVTVGKRAIAGSRAMAIRDAPAITLAAGMPRPHQSTNPLSRFSSCWRNRPMPVFRRPNPIVW